MGASISETRENGHLSTEMAIRAVSLPKVVNQVVNQGSEVVNRTCQSCESPFPPAKSCESMENSNRANEQRWRCFGRAQREFTVHGRSLNRHQFTPVRLRPREDKPISTVMRLM